MDITSLSGRCVESFRDGGVPGPTVIGRGMRRMEAAACAIKNLRQMQSGTQM